VNKTSQIVEHADNFHVRYKLVALTLSPCYFLPYGNIFGQDMSNDPVQYGAVRSAEDLGKLVRAHRKHRKLTLETISGLGNLSTRFLSEFERGKETAELGKVLQALRTLGLEVVIQPRGSTPSRPFSKKDGGRHA
jgi:HTH-type transcriptional regulator / antitoxin HipB